MSRIDELLSNNRRWAEHIQAEDPHFFAKLSKLQTPNFLWIGCADSRVPATQIVDMHPGGIFVHRNVANVVAHSDLNALSVIQFAVDVLKVEHILVVGHYGCGGVSAVLKKQRLGLTDNWLRHVADVANAHVHSLSESLDFDKRHNRLCELNAVEQAMHVCATSTVQEAWLRGQTLRVHAWVYGLNDGLIQDLGLDVSDLESMTGSYRHALDTLAAKWADEDTA